VGSCGHSLPLPDSSLLWQLMLRDCNLQGFASDVLRRLGSLRVLSLSHNKFTSLAGFGALENLLEVRCAVPAVLGLWGMDSQLACLM